VHPSTSSASDSVQNIDSLMVLVLFIVMFMFDDIMLYNVIVMKCHTWNVREQVTFLFFWSEHWWGAGAGCV